MKKSTISAIILAKNAQNMLVDCMESVAFCYEIIIVDSASSDLTVEIAKKHGAKIIKGEDGNFAENRNKGLKAANAEWVLYVDTDERVSEELKKNIRGVIASETKQSSSSIVAYKLQRKNFYLRNHPWPQIEYLERLFKKNALKEWYGKLHETAKINGAVGVLDGYLLHYTHRDLASMLDKTIAWSQIEAQLRYDNHHPKIVTWRLIRVMLTGFWDSYIKQKGYKAGTMGLIESMYQAYSMFITYAVLWEMQRGKVNV